jgi:phospholipid/cholesterol/gamma-HCH transport system substrate-binding protein
METRANYVLIGAFVLMGAAALMLFTLWISGSSFRRELTTYDVVFEGPVNGLSEGGEVRFNGIKVGEVTRLSLDRQDPNRVIARVKVDAQTPVRSDSVAQLDFLGITGVTFIQILAGTPTAPLMESETFGDVPVIRTERTALDELFSGGQDLLTVAGAAINRVNEALSDENIAEVAGILHNLNIASAKIARDGGVIDQAAASLASLNRAARAIEETATSVNTLVQNVDGDVEQIVADAGEMLADLKPAVEEARRAIRNLDGAVAQINEELAPNANLALQEFGRSAGEFNSLLLRLQGLAMEVEQDPSRFVYRRPQPVE